MSKTVALLLLMQAFSLLVVGYVHEGERTQEDQIITPSFSILKQVEDESTGALVNETDRNYHAVNQSIYANQDAEFGPTASVTIEPSWLSSHEDAEEFFENWDPEDGEQTTNADSAEADILRSGDVMPTSTDSNEKEFSNLVYEHPTSTQRGEDYPEEYQYPGTNSEYYSTGTADSNVDEFYIKPYTMESHYEEDMKPRLGDAVIPRFEEPVSPQFETPIDPPFETPVDPPFEEPMLPEFKEITESQLAEALPPYDTDPTYVTTVGGTENWGDFSLDDYQGRQRLEEEVKAELTREPPRSLHRSPVPWLQRDVNQLGEPRQHVCQLELDRGLGPDEVSSWYYDSREMRCRWFGYRGYAGNANRFASRAACEGYCIKDMENLCEAVQCSYAGTHCALVSDQPCMDTAKTYGRDWRTKCPPEQPVCMSRRSTRIAPDIDFRSIPIECLQEKDPGSCERKNPSVMFHYDRERNDCMTFYFHDCGGNDNRFETKSDCMTHCSP